MRRWIQKLIVVLATGYILFFVGVRIPATPRSAIILPPLLVAGAFGLNRNRLDERGGHIPLRSCLWLLLAPITAIAVYAPLAVWGWKLPTNLILYKVTTPLGLPT